MKKIGIVLLCILQCSCSGQTSKKINGVSFVASRQEVKLADVNELGNIYANSAAVMPFGFIRDIDEPKIIFNTERQWFGERREGAKQYIELLQANGISVMLKPQLWISRGVFTGTLKMKNETDWQELESSYRAFIITYAELAEECKVALFCIGTELQQFVVNRPEYWAALILEIKKVYKGKLTYASNWDEFDSVPFWKQMDYVGIDAYFPLSETKNPTVDELVLGWQPWKIKIVRLSEEMERPVLFTEYGYRSMDFTAKKPWLVDRSDERPNMESQVNAKKAIFKVFWDEKWFAGGYVWKWFIDHHKAGGADDNRFTPQGKPSLKIISEQYKKYGD
ncbi:MAG: glycoside hydrolase [Maribacter sp.]